MQNVFHFLYIFKQKKALRTGKNPFKQVFTTVFNHFQTSLILSNSEYNHKLETTYNNGLRALYILIMQN